LVIPPIIVLMILPMLVEIKDDSGDKKGTGYFLSLQHPISDNQERSNSSFESLSIKK